MLKIWLAVIAFGGISSGFSVAFLLEEQSIQAVGNVISGIVFIVLGIHMIYSRLFDSD